MSDNIYLRPVRLNDLELMLAWRSDPEIYKHFREQEGPLNWDEHVNWFANRPDRRHDMMIEYKGRRVGVVNIDEESYVGVYVGEKMLWGTGIGSRAVDNLCDKFGRENYYAEIHAENKSSQRLFKKCGFERVGENDNWFIYKR